MKSNIRNVIYLVCATGLLLSLPLFWANREAIEITLPQLTQEDLTAREQQQQKEAQVSAAKAKWRKIYTCQSDEDCILVDQDPCGCLIGPKGVTAINALYTLEFNQRQSQVIAKTCPDTAPSTEQECSSSARAVCAKSMCKIVY